MDAALDLLLRALPIAVGGGVVQFAIFMLKRRSELRTLDAAAGKTDAESGAVVVTSAEQSVKLSDLVRDNAVKRAIQVEQDLNVQTERVKDLTRRLIVAEDEVEILRGEVTTLRREVARLRAAQSPPEF